MKNQNIAFRLKKKELANVSTEEERIKILEELVALNPKDTVDLEARTRYKKQLETLKYKLSNKKRQRSVNPYENEAFHYPRQVVIIGESNSGKSTLLNKLTSIDVKISESPFTTYKPESGLFRYNDITIQFVEVPALYAGDNDTNKVRFIRNADVICTTAKDLASLKNSYPFLKSIL